MNSFTTRCESQMTIYTEFQPHGVTMQCTRERDHKGMHVVVQGGTITAAWDDTKHVDAHARECHTPS